MLTAARMRLSLLLPAALVTLAGCMPFASLPVDGSVAGGPAPMLRAQGSSSIGVWNGRIALRPGDLAARSHLHRFDYAVGYTVDSRQLFRSVYAHGAFLQVGYYPWVRPDSKRSSVRFGPYLTADWLWSWGAQPTQGWGLSSGLSFEYMGYMAGCSNEGNHIGCGRGLMGIRGFVAVQVRDLETIRYSAAIVGLSFRLPASAGALVAFKR